MAIRIMNNYFGQGKVGISIPADCELEASGNIFHNIEQAIEIRNSIPSLPQETPPEYILEALRILAQHQDANQNIQQAHIKESKLAKWLGPIADAATIIQLLMPFVLPKL